MFCLQQEPHFQETRVTSYLLVDEQHEDYEREGHQNPQNQENLLRERVSVFQLPERHGEHFLKGRTLALRCGVQKVLVAARSRAILAFHQTIRLKFNYQYVLDEPKYLGFLHQWRRFGLCLVVL